MTAVFSADPAADCRPGAFGNATHLVCRACGAHSPLGPFYACLECFGPLASRRGVHQARTLFMALQIAALRPRSAYHAQDGVLRKGSAPRETLGGMPPAIDWPQVQYV